MATELQTKEPGKLTAYLRGVKRETKKVIWPTMKQLTTYTVVVLAVTVAIAVLVYLLDIAIMTGYSYILK